MKIVSIIIVVLTLAACKQAGIEEEKLQLAPAAFAEKLKEDPSIVLLDVRTPAEVKTGFLEGAKTMDFNDEGFTKSLDSLDHDKTYLVYCAKGIRSGKAVTIMKELGFKHVSSLEGGLNAWRANGLPVTPSQN